MLCEKRTCVLGFLVLIWIPITTVAETDLATCTFYYWQSSWLSANKTCQRDGKELLCYSSRKEIDDITEAFRLATLGDSELELWLANKNCSGDVKYVECLSLHITKTSDSVWHYFEEECDDYHYPFVCCLNGDRKPISNFSSSSTIPTDRELVELTTVQETRPTHSSDSCPSVNKKGVHWPDTPKGTTITLPCPGNATGLAKWHCETSIFPAWNKIGPDLQDCRSWTLTDLQSNMNMTNATDALEQLKEALCKGNLYVGDLVDVITMMSKILHKLCVETQGMPRVRRWAVVKEALDSGAEILDIVLAKEETWDDVPEDKKPWLGTNLLFIVDRWVLLVSSSMMQGEDYFDMQKDYIDMQIVKKPYGQEVFLPEFTDSSGLRHHGRIRLEKGYDKLLDPDHGNVSVSFVIYRDMSRILSPPNSTNAELRGSQLNSFVVSAVVAQGPNAVPINGEVWIYFEHRTKRPNRTACVFWNVKRKEWDLQGCRLESSNATMSVCVCQHLTNFALLMSYGGPDSLTFHYITVVGCGLSVICLAACVAVFSCYSYQSKHSWGLRYTIHRNLCLTLLIANLVLILGLDRTAYPHLCPTIAGILHYFFLSAFSWMLLEGVHIYLLLVVVFASRKSHAEKYYIFGYGVPLVIVVITAASRSSAYGTDKACWLSTEKGAIWAFMGPVAVILTLNLAALILAQWKASSISIKHDNMALFKRWLRVTFILFPVLGITWIIGFLFLGNQAETIGYIFAFLNSSQGVCIFVCHCVLDKNARNSVISSLKKTASVDTGSSSSNKKAKALQSVNQNSNNLKSRVFSTMQDAWRKNRPKWSRPWSFCFELSVTDHNTHQTQTMTDDRPSPVAVQWNNLEERA